MRTFALFSGGHDSLLAKIEELEANAERALASADDLLAHETKREWARQAQVGALVSELRALRLTIAWAVGRGIGP